MKATTPETTLGPGVCHALTADGIELPVLDVTNAAFQCQWTDAELRAIEVATLRSLRRSARVPRLVVRWMARRSIVMRGTLAAEGGFLSGMSTYLQKLGPDVLSDGVVRPIDRRLLGSIGPVSVRLRVRQIARLIAEALRSRLERRAGALHLLNIGGGASADSINALLLLRQEQPRLLAGRHVRIHTLDVDAVGPRFGARSLEALQAPGGPLCGLDAALQHWPSDWADVSALRARLSELRGSGAVLVASSEGGLFEYGSEAEVVAHLSALRDEAPDDFVMVGSLARDNALLQTMCRIGKLALVLRGPEAFAALARDLGWVARFDPSPNPMYDVVALEKEARP